MTGIGSYEFKVDRNTKKIYVAGTDGDYSLIHDSETYQIWRSAGRHVFSGQGQPQNYSPTRYWVMKIYKIEGEFMVARIIKEITPYQNWRKEVKALIEEVKNLKDE